MRHNVKGRKLNRNSSHRNAMMRNMATNLLRHGSIRTTLAKAKETRPYVEKLITRALGGKLADKRAIIEILNDRQVAHHLINDIAPNFKDRNGGYLRIVKIGPRQGDGAEMALLELVGEEEEKRKKRSSAKKDKKQAVKTESKAPEGDKDKGEIPDHEEKSHARDEQVKEHLVSGSKAEGTIKSSKPAKPKQAVVDRSQSQHKTPPPSGQER
ncbi:50S ribosomal protein L17 [bacterium]|nr:50S ribosomal protein L17 [bacterium]